MSEQAINILGVLAALWAIVQCVSSAARDLQELRDAFLSGRNALSREHLAAIRRDWRYARNGHNILAIIVPLLLAVWSASDAGVRPYWPILTCIGLIPVTVVLYLLPSAIHDTTLFDGHPRLGAALAEFRQQTRVRRRGRVKVEIPQLAKKQRVEVIVRLLRYDDAQEN